MERGLGLFDRDVGRVGGWKLDMWADLVLLSM